jgi:GPH family glycoside/pentoside/hexuronide:cation symporter
MRPLAKTLSYTSGSITANLVSLAFATYVQFYYTDYLQGDVRWIGLAAIVQTVYATLCYPLLGHLSDRTQSRWGRRVPFIIYGALPLGLAFALVWMPPVSPRHPLAFSAYFLATAIFYDTMFNLTMVNWSALFPELFRSAHERAYASACKQMFGIIGLVGGLALPPMVAQSIGWSGMGVAFGIIGTLALWTTIPSMELRRRREEQPANAAQATSSNILAALRYTLLNRSFLSFVGMRFFVQFAFTMLTASLSFYAKYNLNISGTEQSLLLLGTLLVALPLVYVWGFVVVRLGAFASTVLAIGLFAAALIPFFFTSTFASAFVCSLALGIGLSGILILTDVLISDVIDADELYTGMRREGMFYGIHGLIVSLCGPVQAGITTLVLTTSGYTHSGPQPASALLGFKLMITAIPILALFVGLALFFAYPLRKRQVMENKQALAALGQGDVKAGM